MAASLGAAFAGVIFAGGPRELTPARAHAVHSATEGAVQRVGVFGADFRDRIPAVVAVDALDVVQLHGDPTPADIQAARGLFGGEVWAAIRVEGDQIPVGAVDLFVEADAVLLDARAPGRLGGSGVALPWGRIAEAVGRIRSDSRLVLAGGLTAENVAEAVAALMPDVVDVSSGVEWAPGIKDHARMMAFVRAATGSLG